MGEVTSLRKSRVRMTAAAGLALTLGLSGCTSGVCPAIAYIHELTVELGGEAAGVADVQLCADDFCSPAEGAELAAPLGLVRASSHDEETWRFDLDRTHDALTVRTLAADGTVLSDNLVTPEWLRVNGSVECGGRNEAIVEVSV